MKAILLPHQPINLRRPAQQRVQRASAAQEHPAAALAGQPGVAHELQGVAQTLLGLQQQRFAAPQLLPTMSTWTTSPGFAFLMSSN
ncbi:MAG: hypothetical protein B7Z73_02955 [Planctomycetia bacterium 21-64-5]|nr:MAG: hypothetical protein B7Z73_02955 [Planctomycetia bacterium 21-64-5]